MQYRNDPSDKLVAGIRNAMGQLEALLSESASDASSGLTDLKDRMRDRIGSARDTLGDLQDNATQRARAAAYATDEYVHSHTWSTIGAAVALGVVVGLVLNYRR